MPYLVALLDSYQPTFPEEFASKKQIKDFILFHADCFERTCEVGHVTGSAWLQDYTGEKVLLLHHAKLDMWIQPGGHCDGDPDVLGVAIKEAQEESGLDCIEAVSPEIFDIDAHLVPPWRHEKAHYHYDVRFLLRITQPVEPCINQESKGMCWVTKDPSTLPTQRQEILRMHEKWRTL